MRSYVVHIQELDRDFPMIASNVFDAAVYALGEQNPGWIRASCRVTDFLERETYSFRCTASGDRVVFDYEKPELD